MEFLCMQTAVISCPVLSLHSSSQRSIACEALPKMLWQERPENSFVLFTDAQKAEVAFAVWFPAWRVVFAVWFAAWRCSLKVLSETWDFACMIPSSEHLYAVTFSTSCKRKHNGRCSSPCCT